MITETLPTSSLVQNKSNLSQVLTELDIININKKQI